MATTPDTDDIPSRILWQLLCLRAVGAIEFAETARGSGVFRYGFRAGGWPVTIDLDTGVVEMRVYHARDEVAMVRVPEKALYQLLGRIPMPVGAQTTGTAESALAELRNAIAEWKRENPRIFILPPSKVGHPDNWNRA